VKDCTHAVASIITKTACDLMQPSSNTHQLPDATQPRAPNLCSRLLRLNSSHLLLKLRAICQRSGYCPFTQRCGRIDGTVSQRMYTREAGSWITCTLVSNQLTCDSPPLSNQLTCDSPPLSNQLTCDSPPLSNQLTCDSPPLSNQLTCDSPPLSNQLTCDSPPLSNQLTCNSIPLSSATG
jgi:hypothetical protein